MRLTALLSRAVATLGLSFGLATTQAAPISFDLVSSTGGDAYGPGAAVLGTATSQWNTRSRFAQGSNVALFDGTGAATGVTVSYNRLNSGSFLSGVTGTFGNLFNSHLQTETVTLAGLLADTFYDLVIYTNWGGMPGFSVGGQTRVIPFGGQFGDVPSLVEGQHYVRFNALSSLTGTLQFTPAANPTGLGAASFWSAFQLQQAVPEPGSAFLVLAAAGLMVLSRRRGTARR